MTPLDSVQRRLTWMLVGFGLLYAAGPGILVPAGSALLAVAGLAVWAATAARPGRLAWLADLLAGSLYWAGVNSWGAHVWWGTLLYLGPAQGLYTLATGVLLRRLSGRFPLALAAPAAWVGIETLKALPEPPFGYPWMRVGLHLVDSTWLAGSARVWGCGGLGWVLLAAAGLVADHFHGRLERRAGAGSGLRLRTSRAWGLAPLILAAIFARLVPAPATVDGPRVLLIQPGFEQERKMSSPDPYDLFQESLELTRLGLAPAVAGGAPPDLIAWGETMLPIPVVDPRLPEAMESGEAQWDAWSLRGWDVDQMRRIDLTQRNWVDVGLFGSTSGQGQRLIPEGTAFLSGAEFLTAVDGRIRRQNAVLLWKGPGTPEGPGGKAHLVPGAETMLGLERFAGVRDVIFELAGYVPDLLPSDEGTRVFELEGRSGERWRFGVSVCFDNAFDDPYTEPLRRDGPGLDFHLVVSNEAWYRQSQEADQMVAFSRLIALQTGRAVVRATNSGVSMVLAPDGTQVARLVVGERDREVRGTLEAVVPVPGERVQVHGATVGRGGAGAEVGPSGAPRTPFVRFEWAWILAWMGALALLAARSSRTRAAAPPAPGYPAPEAGKIGDRAAVS